VAFGTVEGEDPEGMMRSGVWKQTKRSAKMNGDVRSFDRASSFSTGRIFSYTILVKIVENIQN
jgi:hypothetical protein